jgi:hypothetical protein
MSPPTSVRRKCDNSSPRRAAPSDRSTLGRWLDHFASACPTPSTTSSHAGTRAGRSNETISIGSTSSQASGTPSSATAGVATRTAPDDHALPPGRADTAGKPAVGHAPAQRLPRKPLQPSQRPSRPRVRGPLSVDPRRRSAVPARRLSLCRPESGTRRNLRASTGVAVVELPRHGGAQPGAVVPDGWSNSRGAG